MAAAEAAYDTALKALAAATRRTTLNPRDTAAARDLQLAAEAVATSRTRVESRASDLDHIRVAELLTFETSDAAARVGRRHSGAQPVSRRRRSQTRAGSAARAGLARCDLDLDARSASHRAGTCGDEGLLARRGGRDGRRGITCRVACAVRGHRRHAGRVGRDAAHSHQSRGTCTRRRAGVPDRRDAGRGRAVRRRERRSCPIDGSPSASAPTASASSNMLAHRFRWICPSVSTRRRAETAALANREGEPIQLPQPDALDDRLRHCRAGRHGPRHSSRRRHRSSRRTAGFRPAADADAGTRTPTRSPACSPVIGSAAASPSSRRTRRRTTAWPAAPGFRRAPSASRPRSTSNGGRAHSHRAWPSNGTTAARAFGIAADVFAAMPASGAAPGVAHGAGWIRARIAAAMQTALWQVTARTGARGFPRPSRRTRGRRAANYFRQHVRAAGPVPAMRVGRQPYGVLPVTTLNEFTARSGTRASTRGSLPLLNAARAGSRCFGRAPSSMAHRRSALRHLGRSTHLFAETTQQNPSSTGENRWATLAGSLARSTRNQIRDTWRTNQIKRTVDGTPLPIERAIVDDSTPGELAALAAALPGTLKSRPLHASVLGRMARQAALLEWARLARGACLASVDEASQLDLRRRASSLGSRDLHRRAGPGVHRHDPWPARSAARS